MLCCIDTLPTFQTSVVPPSSGSSSTTNSDYLTLKLLVMSETVRQLTGRKITKLENFKLGNVHSKYELRRISSLCLSTRILIYECLLCTIL
jgi:hypothetical protein